MSFSDSEDEVQPELPEWAQIQRKTFTRWCNQQLKPRDLVISDLQTGLKDGVMLVNLVELLTQSASPTRYTKKPKIKMQMVENIGIGLKILTDDGIKLVNIGNEDIFAGNMKLILGLIWMLILHYQISVDFEGEEGGENEGVTAKKQLMNWASDLVNNLPDGARKIKNFTTDWNDGTALCGMVEAVAPGLCPEFAYLDPENKLDNARLGLDRAEKGLGVPKILEAEDLVNPNIDELSVLTYVSLLKNATPKIDLVPTDPLKIKIFGPGIETAWVNTPTQFSVDTTDAGFGKLEVTILDKDGNPVPVELWKKDEETKVQYTPTKPGDHKIRVTYNRKEVPQGTFTVKVLAPCDPTKVQLEGEGLNNAYVNRKTHFIVNATDAGEGDLGVTIVGPTGKIPVDIVELEPLKYSVSYTPEKAGPTLVTVKFSGVEVDGSPVHVEVTDDINPLAIKILTRGLENPIAGEQLKFAVCTAGGGDGDLKVTVVDEDDHPLKVTIGDLDADNKEVTFTPGNHGNHRVTVTWSGQPVPNGDINLEVKKPLDLSACIIGDLTNPIVGKPTHISVDCRNVGSEDLGVEVLASDGTPLKVTIASVGEGQYQATYTATNIGPHKISVKIEDRHVPGSAFTVHGVDPSKIAVNVDNDKSWMVGEPVEVVLSLSEAGPGELGVQLSAPPGSGTDCQATQVSPGVMSVLFTPTAPGEHVVNLTFDDQKVPSTPVLIRVIPKANAGAVVVSGEGVREAQVGKTVVFLIDTSKAGPGLPDVKIRGPKNPIDASPMEIGDGLYEVSYTPVEDGPHIIAVKFADQHVPGSAFRPTVTKGSSAEDVVAYGKGLEEEHPPQERHLGSSDFSFLQHEEGQASMDPGSVVPDEDVPTSEEMDIVTMSELRETPSQEEKEEEDVLPELMVEAEDAPSSEEENIPQVETDEHESSSAIPENMTPEIPVITESSEDDMGPSVPELVEAPPLQETEVVPPQTVDVPPQLKREEMPPQLEREEVVVPPEEMTLEQPAQKQHYTNIIPYIHVICSAILLLQMILETSLSSPTNLDATLSTLLLGYFIAMSAVDLEMVSGSQETSSWLAELFSSTICPAVLCYSSNYLLVDTPGCMRSGLGVATLGSLILLEMVLIGRDLNVWAVLRGIAGIICGMWIYGSVVGIGEPQPILDAAPRSPPAH